MFTRLQGCSTHGRLAKRVLLICRSSCLHGAPRQENEHAVDDGHQKARLGDWLRKNVHGPYRLIVVTIDTKGGPSGRAIKPLVAALKTGLYDLVLVDSLDRLSRDPKLYQFLRLADELKTRIVAVEDNVVTALQDENDNSH